MKTMQWLSWLLWLQKRNREFNGWFAESHIDYYLDGAVSEIGEIKKSIQDKNHDELELEVGDLLWDVLSLINKPDHEKLIDMERVCPRAVGKFAERMPYNVEWYFEWDPVKREELWNAVKKLQKARWIDERHCLVQKVWESVKNNKT